MAVSYYAALIISDSGLADTDFCVNNWKLRSDSPVFILLFLTEKFNTFVDFDVLFTTDVRGLELVVRHDDSELN